MKGKRSEAQANSMPEKYQNVAKKVRLWGVRAVAY